MCNPCRCTSGSKPRRATPAPKLPIANKGYSGVSFYNNRRTVTQAGRKITCRNSPQIWAGWAVGLLDRGTQLWGPMPFLR
jgi:hypothetical protein